MIHRPSIVIGLWLAASGLGLARVQAQSSVQAAGGVATGTGGTATYAVGQLTTTIATGPGGTSSPGVLQPFEISVLSTAKSAAITLDCSAYPIPTSGTLTLRIDEPTPREFTWRLADITGRKLAGESATGNVMAIPMQELPEGSYLLYVERKNQIMKTFKVIKH